MGVAALTHGYSITSLRDSESHPFDLKLNHFVLVITLGAWQIVAFLVSERSVTERIRILTGDNVNPLLQDALALHKLRCESEELVEVSAELFGRHFHLRHSLPQTQPRFIY